MGRFRSLRNHKSLWYWCQIWNVAEWVAAQIHLSWSECRCERRDLSSTPGCRSQGGSFPPWIQVLKIWMDSKDRKKWIYPTPRFHTSVIAPHSFGKHLRGHFFQRVGPLAHQRLSAMHRRGACGSAGCTCWRAMVAFSQFPEMEIVHVIELSCFHSHIHLAGALTRS